MSSSPLRSISEFFFCEKSSKMKFLIRSSYRPRIKCSLLPFLHAHRISILNPFTDVVAVWNKFFHSHLISHPPRPRTQWKWKKISNKGWRDEKGYRHCCQFYLLFTSSHILLCCCDESEEINASSSDQVRILYLSRVIYDGLHTFKRSY